MRDESARAAWSWGFGGAAVALAIAATGASYAHQWISGSMVLERRSLISSEDFAKTLLFTYRAIWLAAFLAVGLGAAAYFIGARTSRARWLALAGFVCGCVALWFQYEYLQCLKWC